MRQLATVAGTAVLTLLPLTLVSSAAVAAEDGVVRMGNAEEAWYSSAPAPACESPVGCPVDTDPEGVHREGSLQVGAAAGQETARTYVRRELTPLPPGAVVTSARLVLPFAEDSSLPESATLLACPVTEGFTDGVAGSYETPPPADCEGAPVSELAEDGQSLTVDVTALVKQWAAGSPDLGIALVPAPADGPPQTWRLVFERRDSPSATPASVITWVTAFTRPGLEPAPVSPPHEAAPLPPADFGGSAPWPQPAFEPPAFGTGPLPAPPEAAPEPVPGPQAAPPAPQEVRTSPAVRVAPWFAQPGLAYLPLLLLLGLLSGGRALSVPVPAMKTRS